MNTSSATRPLILVTGSAGLIGSRLVKSLSRDYEVIGLDVCEPKQEAYGTDWLECDLTDESSVGQALYQIREQHGDLVAAVVHLAAYYDFSGEPSPLYDSLTVDGTRRLLRHLERFSVDRFIFSSSLLAMKPSEETLTEQSPVQAEWDYPQSKLAAEQVIHEQRKDIPATILRIAGAYDEDCHSIPLAQQMSRIYEKRLESFVFPGDSDHGQSFIHMNDIVGSIQATIAARNELTDIDTFLIGEEDVMSYGELQDALGKLIHGTSWSTIRVPKAAAKAGAWIRDRLAGEEGAFIKPWMIELADQNYCISIRQARERLGWAPLHSLRATLPEMARRLTTDPARWYELNGLRLPDDVKAEDSAEVSR